MRTTVITKPHTLKRDIECDTLKIECKGVTISGKITANRVIAPYGVTMTHPDNKIGSFIGTLNMTL